MRRSLLALATLAFLVIGGSPAYAQTCDAEEYQERADELQDQADKVHDAWTDLQKAYRRYDRAETTAAAAGIAAAGCLAAPASCWPLGAALVVALQNVEDAAYDVGVAETKYDRELKRMWTLAERFKKWEKRNGCR